MRPRIRVCTTLVTLCLLSAQVSTQGCKERETLEKEAPALAQADLRVDRIAIAGVVSDVPSLGDSAGMRESWSSVLASRLARERFGALPIMSSSEVRAAFGRHDLDAILDGYKAVGSCDSASLAELHMILDGKARFVVFGNIQKDLIERSESESDIVDPVTKETTGKKKTMTTTRTTSVRLRFYDLRDQRLAWDYVAAGQSAKSKEKDMTDVIKHSSKESFLSGLVTSIANSALKPDPNYPADPAVEQSLGSAFDNVGVFLKPSKKK